MMVLWPVMALGAAIGMLFASRLLLHYFQLESYQFQGYFRTLLRQWKKACIPGAVLCITFLIIHLLLAVLPRIALFRLIAAVVMVVPGLFLAKKAQNTPQKKKFVITARVKRLYAVHGTVLFVLMLLFAAALSSFPLPLSVFSPAGLIIGSLGSMAAGFFCSLMSREKGFFFGILCGALLFAILLTVALLVWQQKLGTYTLVKFFTMLLSGAIGGILGVNSR